MRAANSQERAASRSPSPTGCDASRRRVGGVPADAGHGRVRCRQRQGPHREALSRGQGALPAVPGRRAVEPGRCARQSQPVDRGDRPAGPRKARRRHLLSRVGERFVGALLRQRQRRARIDREPEQDAEDPQRAVSWMATDEKFFLLAAVPYPETPPGRDRTCTSGRRRQDAGQVKLSSRERTVPPGGETSYPFTLFAGPKVWRTSRRWSRQRLPASRSHRSGAELDKAVDVSLASRSGPILSLLKFFHRFVPQLGPGDRPAHDLHQAADVLPDAEVADVGQEDAEAGAQDGGHPQEVRERPAAPVGRDDEPLQGARRVAVRRLPAEPDPDADLDRAVLDAQLRGRALPRAVLRPHPGPDRQGPFLHHAAGDGRRHVPADADVARRAPTSSSRR